jgi:tight adherence protein B
MNAEQLINIIVMIALFGLIFSVWCICIFLWLGQYFVRLQSVQKRLGIVRKESDESQTLRLWRETKQDQDAEDLGSSEELTFGERLERLRDATGWRTPVHMVVMGVIGTAILGFVVTYLLSGEIVAAFGVSVVILIAFQIYMQKLIVKRSALFERQLVDALGIAARALRAGLPLLGCFQLISEEIDEPVGDIFFRICHEQLLGSDLKNSIRKVARTVYNPELKLFATAVAIQLQSGGNLADLMDSLSSVMRARMRLNRRIRVLIAQTQMSKRILIALPIILFFLLNVMSPEYMATFYTTTIGRFMLILAVSTVALGAWVMSRLTVLRF